MRTLIEIIEAAKIGEPTTHEECLYALLAYDGLSTFDQSALRRMSRDSTKVFMQREAEESFRRWQVALSRSPKAWLGPNFDPANPECRRRVELSRKLADKIISESDRVK